MQVLCSDYSSIVFGALHFRQNASSGARKFCNKQWESQFGGTLTLKKRDFKNTTFYCRDFKLSGSKNIILFNYWMLEVPPRNPSCSTSFVLLLRFQGGRGPDDDDDNNDDDGGDDGDDDGGDDGVDGATMVMMTVKMIKMTMMIMMKMT